MFIPLFLAVLIAACVFDSPLLSAIKSNDLPKIRILLDSGQDVNGELDDEKRSALLLGSFYGDPELIKLLIEKGADVNATDKYGRTALHFAARAGKCENIGVLVTSGAQLERTEIKNYYTPLMEAAWAGKSQAAGCLAQVGSGIDSQDGFGFTALMHAVWSRDAATVKILLEAGADKSLRNRQGDTAAAIAKKIEQEEISRIIASHD